MLKIMYINKKKRAKRRNKRAIWCKKEGRHLEPKKVKSDLFKKC